MLKLEAKIKYDQYGNITIYSPNQVTISATNGLNLGSQGTLSLSSIFQSNDTGNFSASGGSGADTGNNTISYGSSHATLAGDYKIRYNTTDVFHYDHSGGLFDLTGKDVVDAPKIRRSVNNDVQSISGGDSEDTGANIELYGGAHATLAGDVKIRFDTTDIFHYDHSASTYDFKTKAFIGVDDVSVGSDASVAIYSGGTSNVLGGIVELYGENHATKAGDVDIKSSATDVINYDNSTNTININANSLIGVTSVFNDVNNSATSIYGGTDTTSSGVILYGVSHATKANDIELVAGGSVEAHYDHSASVFDLQANTIQTTGTAQVTSVTFGSAGPQDLKGTGDPEGSVTAPQGSTLRRTDGGSGTTFYNKISGSGNTGWEAVGTGVTLAFTQAYNATPSGASVDITSIPSGVNEIHIVIKGVSTSGAGTFNIQLGDSGGIEATGYSGSYGDIEDDGTIAGNTSTMSTFFGLHSDASNDTRSAYATLTRFDGNTWAFSSNLINNSGSEQIGCGAGDKTLSGELDRIRINAGGASTFAGGNIRVAYR